MPREGVWPATSLLLTAMSRRAELMVDVAAAKSAAEHSGPIFDSAQELRMLKAAAIAAKKEGLPSGAGMMLAQLNADCAKHVQAHHIAQWDDHPPRPNNTLAELRQQLEALNARIFREWSSAASTEWSGPVEIHADVSYDSDVSYGHFDGGCNELRSDLLTMIDDRFHPAGPCGTAPFKEMFVSVLTSVALACTHPGAGDAVGSDAAG